jgi:hypothetical protein
MALSPQYSWPEPDNSSLVKNGAQDIRALGDAIDTSVWNVGYGQAGKNKLINGDFNINQRSFSSSTSTGYTLDRWRYLTTGGTCTASVQTFTAGAAPVAGYEAKNYYRIVTSGQSAASDQTRVQQSIESVRTFAGQPVTVSFWAKANTGTPKVAVELEQNFGSGGSASVNTTGTNPTLSTSWARYSVTATLPSISGKTIGTDDSIVFKIFVSAGTDFNARTTSLGIQSNTFEIWGVQIEYGSKATPFQTATGTIQGELAACQRYYFRTVANNAYARLSQFGNALSATSFYAWVQPPVPMRTTPTAIEYSANLGAGDNVTMVAAITSISLSSQTNNSYIGFEANVASGLTTYRGYNIIANNSTTSYIAATAEL